MSRLRPREEEEGEEDDVFGGVFRLGEEEAAAEAERGRLAGRAKSLEEGRALGLSKGRALGEELGFYIGCVRAWRALERAGRARFSERALRTMATLEALVGRVPLGDPHAERLQENVLLARAKFKVLSAALGVHGTFSGLRAAGQMSF